jgi:hypothetical protein
MNTQPLDVPSVAREELDALLLKTAPKRSYVGLVGGVACVMAAAVGGYALAQSPYAAPQPNRRQVLVSRPTFDSLTKYVLALERRIDASTNQHSETMFMLNSQTKNIEESMNQLRADMRTQPVFLSSVISLDDSTECISVRVFDYDRNKHEIGNNKTVLLCEMVNP